MVEIIFLLDLFESFASAAGHETNLWSIKFRVESTVAHERPLVRENLREKVGSNTIM